MDRNCGSYQEALAHLAGGGEEPGARDHAAKCKHCGRILDELRQILAWGKMPVFDAPPEVVLNAQSIFPESVVRTARLIPLGPRLALARSDSDDFQLLVGDGEVRCRLMYTKRRLSWEVLGQVPGPEWSVERRGEVLDPDPGGRFSFWADSLADTEFTLLGRADSIRVPSAENLVNDAAFERP